MHLTRFGKYLTACVVGTVLIGVCVDLNAPMAVFLPLTVVTILLGCAAALSYCDDEDGE